MLDFEMRKKLEATKKQKEETMIFILIHGSWHNGSAWYKVEHLLKQRGATVYTPTLTGMESFQHPASEDIGLTIHIQDIVHLIQENKLENVILVGHSYSGLILAGVAELIPDKVDKLVYLDAFIPEDNQSLFDLMSQETIDGMRSSLVNAEGKSKQDGAEEVWLLPPGEPQAYGVVVPEDVAWLQKHMVYTPVLTFEEPVTVKNPAAQDIARYFIRCTEFNFLAPYEHKAKQAGWPVFQIKSAHDAMIIKPNELTDIFLQIAHS